MWLFSKTGFISVVVDRGNSDRLLVRARFAGDIEQIFGPAILVRETPFADYRFRAFIRRREFTKIVARMIDEMDYDNFKNAVAPRDPERISAYMSVWSVMERAQQDKVAGEESEEMLRRMGWSI